MQNHTSIPAFIPARNRLPVSDLRRLPLPAEAPGSAWIAAMLSPKRRDRIAG